MQVTPDIPAQVSAFYGGEIAHDSMMWGDDTTVFGVTIPSAEERAQIRHNLDAHEAIAVPDDWRGALRTRMHYDWLNTEYPSLKLSPASFWGRLIAGFIGMFVEVDPHLHNQEALQPAPAAASSSYGAMGWSSPVASSSSTPAVAPLRTPSLFGPSAPPKEADSLLGHSPS